MVNSSVERTKPKHKTKLTFAQETAITIFAPDFAIPFASDFDPTYHIRKPTLSYLSLTSNLKDHDSLKIEFKKKNFF